MASVKPTTPAQKGPAPQQSNLLPNPSAPVRIGDSVWYEDVAVLIRRPLEFWPSRDQTTAEQLNTFVRLIAYATVAVFAYNMHVATIFVGIVLIALVTLVYRGRGGKFAGLQAVIPPKCRMPTKNNPFMNVPLTEYGKTFGPPTCNYDEVKAEMRTQFNDGLYRNIEDIYENENSQRQFFTVPNGGNPPDRTAFAKFLYGNQRNCKMNPSQCSGND